MSGAVICFALFDDPGLYAVDHARFGKHGDLEAHRRVREHRSLTGLQTEEWISAGRGELARLDAKLARPTIPALRLDHGERDNGEARTDNSGVPFHDGAPTQDAGMLKRLTY